MEHRPNPESLLRRVQEEERREFLGKLKIYLGASPGVGKTYTMLQDALVQRGQGLDVVVGVVESHGRQEIESLLKHFELLPRQKVDYHGKELLEFDIDAALKRNPGLILIDEMAHTNAPGVRHPKRWQDIKEILDRGIDVCTTLNVQHIESLNDIVSQIIHSRVRETVPDSMLELANTIELVDLPPEDLLKRLREGKVYIPKQAELAEEHFFRVGNLIALRELALRVMAERVSAQVMLYRRDQGIKHVWPIRDKFLVCVGSGPESAKLIRVTRRLANSLQVEWIAVHVDVQEGRVSEERRKAAIQNLRLAEQLGAEIRILPGYNVVNEIINFARAGNVTTIVIWKKIHSRWFDYFSRNLADEMLRQSGEIDVYIVTGVSDVNQVYKVVPEKRVFQWKMYGVALGIVAIATAINFFLQAFLHTNNFIMIYILGVTVVALYGRLGPSCFASVLSVLAYDYFFVPPVFSFAIADRQYFFTLAIMLAVSLLISNLTIRTRYQAESARLAEHYTAALHTLSRQLASTRGVDKLLDIATRYISEVFHCQVLALMPENNHLAIHAGFRAEKSLNTKEEGVAQWVYELGQVAGLGTDTLPFSEALYLPLLGSQETIGVLRVVPINSKKEFTPEQMHLLESCASQVALALEVDRMQETRNISEFHTEMDRAQNLLLKSVSHDLRTPLVAAMGAASTLIELGGELDTKKIIKLGGNIYSELEQLSRLINNLLKIANFETETLKLQKELCSMNDIIHLAIQMQNKIQRKRKINTHIQTDLPMISLDKVLIIDVINNLLDNAIKFAPDDSPIEISAVLRDNYIIVCIEDCGPGIVSDEVNKLFEKFYRGRMLTTERGMGLGLAISRIIVNAHNGLIWAENRTEGGAVFRFSLPLS